MGGSTWLASLNVLALYGCTSAPLRRSASRTRQTASDREVGGTEVTEMVGILGSMKLRDTGSTKCHFRRLCDGGRFATAAFDRGRSEISRVAQPRSIQSDPVAGTVQLELSETTGNPGST